MFRAVSFSERVTVDLDAGMVSEIVVVDLLYYALTYYVPCAQYPYPRIEFCRGDRFGRLLAREVIGSPRGRLTTDAIVSAEFLLRIKGRSTQYKRLTQKPNPLSWYSSYVV